MVILDDDGMLRLDWVTPREAAAQVRVSVKTVYAWAAAGQVKVLRYETARANEPKMLIELQSLMDCEAALRKGRMGRPRAGTERGRS